MPCPWWDHRAVPTQPVIPVDTTAAGDSFNAVFVAAHIRGRDPVPVAQAGHRLAAHVIGYRGAIAPPLPV